MTLIYKIGVQYQLRQINNGMNMENTIRDLDTGDTIELFVYPEFIDTVKEMLDDGDKFTSFNRWKSHTHHYQMTVPIRPGFISKKEVIDIIYNVNTVLNAKIQFANRIIC
jgi:hypothetical protein